ncbi:MAG TPA: LptF/LptG family permease [Chryseosolibacter sp.]|nr:LptF/LptG family permease [Chryseosolibacter sp.]
MKKIDKLILSAFIGPFFLTFLVVVFILLNIQMLKYFDDLIGKGLEWASIAELLFYFAIFTTPTAFPLAILLSSLIAFGNLGEHFELTAIKSAGISLVRALVPIFVFVIGLTAIAFYTNNNLVPKAALEAYSLLYDIKQKKPALDLREGTFYNGIPDISIKVDRKYTEDEAALGGVVVYDHQKNDGNKEVTKADSGRMYTILNERYIKFELFNGYHYTEGATDEKAMTGQKNKPTEAFTRTKFGKTEVVYDLSSFEIKRTDKKWFQGNRIMRNLNQLDYDIDSIKRDVLNQRLNYYSYRPGFFLFLSKNDSLVLPKEVQKHKRWKDSVQRLELLNDSSSAATVREAQLKIADDQESGEKARTKDLNKKDAAGYQVPVRPDTLKSVAGIAAFKKDSSEVAKSVQRIIKSLEDEPSAGLLRAANGMARQAKSQVVNSNASIETYSKELVIFQLQWHKIWANSLACIAMFLIGAPLGAIIKKGGLGVPFLVSIIFFIIYYVLSMQGEKLAKQEIVSPFWGVWSADFILVAVGLIFLRQARVDARIFESDFYAVIFDKIGRWTQKQRNIFKLDV